MSELPKPVASNALAPADPRDDPWAELRSLTPARIALGRSGASLPTREVLAFGIAHAQARDAVQAALDVDALAAALQPLSLPIIRTQSAAETRSAYLARPDWGRRLSPESRQELDALARSDGPEVLLVIADGLSAVAPQRHASALISALLPQLDGLRIGPLVIATQARVALADEIAESLGARLVVCLIGERPGLSSPDSLGAYLTYAPKVGTTDEARICISNIRPKGCAIGDAATLIAASLRAALATRRSGVALREPSNLLPTSDQKP
ncbi:ethanolamine ammonia-lyase subunit EutC [Nevskia ramosa]|uniref:ethanolamine ammonia-lyase subunit EutC n=1 Tax=Nevskia ramosa TaxID=64002 RepID=UPI002356D5EC|nr:ethanolamine ammonia-lyase subunit EutC [Nevskia ramosa]